MAVVIDVSPNPFLFTFTEPFGVGPTKVFSASTGFTFTPTLATAFFDATLALKSFNSANVDRNGQNRADIFYNEIFDVFPSNVDTAAGTGTVNVTLNAPFNFYDRLGAGETLVVKYDLRVLTTQNNTDGVVPVQITFKGRNDLPQAVNDVAVIPDGFSGFRMYPLFNDKDVDIHDFFRITDAVRFGGVHVGPNTVLPPEFVLPPAPGVGHDADEILLNIPRYYQFLYAGESMTFKVKYTMTDGSGGVSSAFVVAKIQGQKTSTFVGTGSGDRMLGENDKDTMNGNAGNDIIQARAGNDSLIGGQGNDRIDGGAGADQLSGGPGADWYDFNKVGDSGKTAATRDVIKDFFPEDTIDLFHIDARTGGGPNDIFKFIGTQGFHGVKGELRYGAIAGGVVVAGDVNGDRKADFQIEVRGVTSLVGNDFEL